MKKHCQGTEPEEVLSLVDKPNIYQAVDIGQEKVNNQRMATNKQKT